MFFCNLHSTRLTNFPNLFLQNFSTTLVHTKIFPTPLYNIALQHSSQHSSEHFLQCPSSTVLPALLCTPQHFSQPFCMALPLPLIGLHNTSLQHFCTTLFQTSHDTCVENFWTAPKNYWRTLIDNTSSVQHLCTTPSLCSLPHFSTTLLYNTSLQHFSTTLLRTTFLHHFPTTLFPTLLCNTSLPTLLHSTFSNKFFQHFPTTLF